MNDKILKTMYEELCKHGVLPIKVIRRAWYNPMRWLKGEFYMEVILQKRLYRTEDKQK